MRRFPPISLRLRDELPVPVNRERSEAGSPHIPKPHHGHSLHPIYANDPVAWTRQCLRFLPDPVQADLLQAADPLILLNCTRQWGKTTVIAAKALHFALFHPKTITLVAAPSERQSLMLLRRLQSFIQTLRIKSAPVPNIPLSILLPNGSEIIALPASADTVRGFTAHLLIYDEAARVPDALYHALSPTRATTSGPLWLLSTPNGPTGFFFDAWHDADTPCRRFLVPASACARITQSFLDLERLSLGDVVFRQEYMCEFIAGPHTFLSQELLEAAIDTSVEPLFGGKLQWS